APPRLDVLVEAVVGDVQLAVGEPGAVRGVPLEALRRRPGPGEELLGEPGPERLVVALGLLVDARVADDRLRAEPLGWGEGAALVEQRLDRGLGVLRRHGL